MAGHEPSNESRVSFEPEGGRLMSSHQRSLIELVKGGSALGNHRDGASDVSHRNSNEAARISRDKASDME